MTPDAILLDIMMPGMNGLEVCHLLKNRGDLADIPVIFLSAAGEEEMIEQGVICGGADYVSKPFSKRVLLVRLIFHIERGALQKAIIEKNKELDSRNNLLVESESQLKMAIQKLQILSGITRHDILNKITSLTGYIVLIKEYVSDDEAEEYINRARDNVETIRKQITFIRDYQEMGIQSPQWQNIGDIMHQVIRSLDTRFVTLVI